MGLKNLFKIAVIIFAAFAIFNISSAQNMAGMPDPDFGVNGQVITPLGQDEWFVTMSDMAIQPDGKIVALGEVWYLSGTVPAGDRIRFRLVRYNSDGSLDTTFGTNGISTISFGGNAQARSLAIQPDGKILATGEMSRYSSLDIVIARYNPDGSLDKSFGESGLVIADLAYFEEYSNDTAAKIALGPDGKIIVVGNRVVVPFLDSDNSLRRNFVVVARFNNDGGLDTTFGNGGRVSLNLEADEFRITIAEFQRDGKILLSGERSWISSTAPLLKKYESVLVRITNNGELDTNFVGGGFASYGGSLGVTYFSELPNQQILTILGWVYLLDSNGRTLRTLAPVPVMINGRILSSLTYANLQQDGKLIIAGTVTENNKTLTSVTRFLANGQVDTAFANNGIYIDPSNLTSRCVKVIIQPDGKIILGGHIQRSIAEFFLTRLNGDPISLKKASPKKL